MASTIAGRVDTIVILAGGAGTRLWPVSTPTRPKQFFDPGIGTSLLRATIERAVALPTTAPIIIVTHIDQVAATRAECADLQPQMAARIVILAEPHSRNSAPAIAYAAHWRTQQTDSDPAQCTTLVMPADHLITTTEQFSADVDLADQLARRGTIALFGIRPTHSATGYGYIETAEPLADGHATGYNVAGFHEKPDRATADRWWRTGRHWWNSGILLYRDDIMLGQLEQHVRAIWQPFADLRQPGVRTEGDSPRLVVPDKQLSELYQRLTPISIDYALLEHSTQISLLPASFDWSDIGSWDEVAAIHDKRDGESSGTVAPFEIESRDNFIMADMPVALCGIENAIVVAWQGRLLICRRQHSQLVRQVPGQVLDKALAQ